MTETEGVYDNVNEVEGVVVEEWLVEAVGVPGGVTVIEKESTEDNDNESDRVKDKVADGDRDNVGVAGGDTVFETEREIERVIEGEPE